MSTRSRNIGFVIAAIAAHAVVALLPYASPYSPEQQHRMYPLAPPAAMHFSLAEGVFVCALTPAERFGEYTESCDTRYSVTSSDPSATLFLMGTDELGRDVFSRFLTGARQSLFAAEAATILALLIAVAIGALGGYRGGIVDRVCLRAGDVFLALPWLYAVLALRGALPLSASAGTMTMLTVLLLAVVGWVRPARVFRAIVMTTRREGYVLAAMGLGAPLPALLARHVAPAVASAALTQATILIPQFLLAEVALSVLGVLGDSASGWGSLVAALQHYAVVSSAWWLALPAAFIVGILVLFHKLADVSQRGLRPASVRGSL